MKIKLINSFIFVFVATLFVLSLPFASANAVAPNVNANGFVLINADTLEVLHSGNAHKRLPMASTTKIMTALLLAEQNTPDKTVVTTKEMVTVEGSSMGLLEGDTVSYHALLAGMLLASGNDAANTTAIALGGSVDNFVKMMNDRAAKIGMTNTNFVTPSGLDAKEHYSTAYDMALLTATAMKNDAFRDMVKLKKITVNYGNPPYNRTLSNHNKLLSKYDYCIGVKTGFTTKSGRCLVSAASKDGCNVIAVTLNAPDDWDDHIKLLDYGLQLLSPTELTYKLPDDTIAVVGGNTDRVRITTDKHIVGITKNTGASVETEFAIRPFIYAPVAPGEVVGVVMYKLGGNIIHTENVYTIGDVKYIENKQSFALKVLYKIKDILLLLK